MLWVRRLSPGTLNKNHRTSLGKSLRGHVLHESGRLLALRLDIVNGIIVPFLFGVLVIELLKTDGNRGGENDDALDLAAGWGPGNIQ